MMENLEPFSSVQGKEIKKSFDTAQDREIELIKERNKRVEVGGRSGYEL